MKSLFTLCAAAILAACLYAVPAAGAQVEGEVKDAQGKVVMEGPMQESDIPRLVQYLAKGGTEAMYSRDIILKFGRAAVPAIINSLPELTDAIADNNNAGGYIIGVFSGIKDDRLAKALSKYIDHPNNRVSGNIRGMLIGYGEAVVPLMMKMLSEPGYHDAALSVLGGIKPTKQEREHMRTELKSADAQMRADAAMLLGRWGDAESAGAISKLLLEDPDPQVRRGAVTGYYELHEKGLASDVDVLLKSLQDTDVEVRRASADMLSGIDDPRVMPAFVSLLGREKDHGILITAINMLAENHDYEAAFPIMKLLDGKDPDQENFQSTVAWALGELDAKEAKPYIMDVLAGDAPLNEGFVKEMLIALEKFGEPVDLAPLLKYLDPARVSDGCCGGDQIDVLLKLIDANAKPGDKDVIEALKRFRPSARPDQAEKVDAILARL